MRSDATSSGRLITRRNGPSKRSLRNQVVSVLAGTWRSPEIVSTFRWAETSTDFGSRPGAKKIDLDIVGGHPDVHRRKGSARRGADAERPCPTAQQLVHLLLEAPELLDQ